MEGEVKERMHCHPNNRLSCTNCNANYIASFVFVQLS